MKRYFFDKLESGFYHMFPLFDTHHILELLKFSTFGHCPAVNKIESILAPVGMID